MHSGGSERIFSRHIMSTDGSAGAEDGAKAGTANLKRCRLRGWKG